MVGTVLLLGVVALNAHAAALTEQQHEHGTDTICVAAQALATLAVSGVTAKCSASTAGWWRQVCIPNVIGAMAVPARTCAARAGPFSQFALRI